MESENDRMMENLAGEVPSMRFVSYIYVYIAFV